MLQRKGHFATVLRFVTENWYRQGKANDLFIGNLSLCTTKLIEYSKVITMTGMASCKDGTFVLEHYICDGHCDCPHCTEEYSCSHVCTFKKKTHSEQSCYHDCIHPRCVCHFLYFQCDNGGCIPMSQLCDGNFDCIDP